MHAHIDITIFAAKHLSEPAMIDDVDGMGAYHVFEQRPPFGVASDLFRFPRTGNGVLGF